MVRAYSDYRPTSGGGGKKQPDPNWTSHTSTGHDGTPVGGYTGPGISGMPARKPFDPNGNHIGPGLQMAPTPGQGEGRKLAPPLPMPGQGPQVTLNNPGNPYTYSSRQTDAAANYSQAQAHRQGDPRAANKAYQRAGLSSSKGTQAAGAADAAGAYSSNMAAAEQARMSDAYANANVQLGSDSMRNQFGQALAGLSEDAAQMQYMQNMQNMKNATGFMGNLFGTMTQPMGGGGGGNGMLSQLLGGLM